MSVSPLVATLGDITGIGPEVLLKALCDARDCRLPPVIISGDLFTVEKASLELGLDLEFARWENGRPLPKRAVPVLQGVPVDDELLFSGRTNPEAGRAAYYWLTSAVSLVLKGGAAGIVTAPANKAAWADEAGGLKGHTEILAEEVSMAGLALKPGSPLMLLFSGALRVALVTTHVPIADLPSLITVDAIAAKARILDAALRSGFSIESPRIGLLALNPHAGEGGTLSLEEREILLPAAETLRLEGIDISDPLPADAAFTEGLRDRFDAFLAMYHDQGLAPFKALSRGAGVNTTLGLPFVRTSPDHGTAYDIAGKNEADHSSMFEALQAAALFVG